MACDLLPPPPRFSANEGATTTYATLTDVHKYEPGSCNITATSGAITQELPLQEEEPLFWIGFALLFPFSWPLPEYILQVHRRSSTGSCLLPPAPGSTPLLPALGV